MSGRILQVQVYGPRDFYNNLNGGKKTQFLKLFYFYFY